MRPPRKDDARAPEHAVCSGALVYSTPCETMSEASRKQLSFSSVAILGPGLLGGSLALAVRKQLPHVHVRLWGRREEPLEYARSSGAAHAASTRLEEVVEGADLVVLATPVGVMSRLVSGMLPLLKPGVLVTDVGSVKGCVHQSVGSALTETGVAFIGSHPMAGSEKQGMEHASGELFRDATCILTNDEHVHEDMLLLLQRFWERVGCHCIRMKAADHDSSVARISHIPHALSALCVHTALDGGDVKLLGLVSAGGFRDTTRVSMGEPSMWAETVSSATRPNLKTEEGPQTVNVITRDLMESKGSDSRVEALRMDSSVNTGGDMLLSRTADQYTIRGFAGTDVQIGYMPLPRGMGYGMDTSLIENIEIVKGPIGSISGGQTSTLGAYGAGGSINLILKAPDFEERTELTAYARLSHHGQKYRVTIDDTRYRGNETDGFALRTVVAAEYERPFWLSNGANGGQKYTVSPIFRWQHDSRTKTVLTTSFQYQNSPTTMGIPVLGGHFVGPYDAWYGSPSGRLNAKSLLAMLDFERKLEKVWTIRIGGGMGYSDVDYNVWGISSSAGRGMSTEDYYNQMIASGKAKYEAAWSDEWNINWNFYSNALAEFKTGQVEHEALMGVSYTGSSTYGDGSSLVTNATANTNGYFSLYNPPPFFPAGRDYSGANATDTVVQRAGVLLQDVLSYGQWRFLAGVRGDAHFSLDNNYAFAWSPRFGITRMFGERVALFANAARTSAPNFGYLDENGKELTDSWRTDQMEFGFRVSPVDKVWFSASWFDIIQNNTPVAIDGYTNRYYSDGSKRAEGVELSLNGEITKNWSSYLSYTYTRTKNRTSGEVYPTIAPNALALWQKYRIDGGLLNGTVLGLGYRCKDSYYATFRGAKIADNYTIPSYSVFDFTVEIPLPETKWLKDATLRLAVYNIFDKKYVQSTRHAVQCTVGEPRTFEVGVKTAF